MKKDKLKNLIHFFVSEIKDIPKVKLAKLLYYTDFEHYAEHNKSITKSEYVRLDFGPCPDNFQEIIRDMTDEGVLEVREKKYTRSCPEICRTYHVFRSIEECDEDLFAANEMATIRKVLKKYGRLSGEKLAQKTHDEIPWKATKPFGVIPYELAWYAFAEHGAESEDAIFSENEKFRESVALIKRKHKEGKLNLTKAS